MRQLFIMFVLAFVLSFAVGCGRDKSSDSSSDGKIGSTLEETIAIISDSGKDRNMEILVAHYSDKMVLKRSKGMGIKAHDIQETRKQLATQLKNNLEKHLQQHPESATVESAYKVENREDISDSKCKLKVTMTSKQKGGAQSSVTAVCMFVKKSGQWLLDEILPAN